jgi:hypothetical protein
MKNLPPILIAAALAGCSVQSQMSASSGGPLISQSGANVSVQSGSSASALVGLGIAGVLFYGTNNGVRYNSNPFMAITGSERAPELAPMRKVNEQDCTRPIEDPSANLKCR